MTKDDFEKLYKEKFGSQVAVAKALGISQAGFSEKVNGFVHFTEEQLNKLCELFDNDEIRTLFGTTAKIGRPKMSASFPSKKFASICLNCPFPKCRSGQCRYYFEERKKLRGKKK